MNRVRVGVGGIVEDTQGRILLLKRSKSPEAGCWSILYFESGGKPLVFSVFRDTFQLGNSCKHGTGQTQEHGLVL